jgi:hypothetical protein
VSAQNSYSHSSDLKVGTVGTLGTEGTLGTVGAFTPVLSLAVPIGSLVAPSILSLDPTF